MKKNIGNCAAPFVIVGVLACIICGTALIYSHCKYSGEKACEEYGQMCNQLQSMLLERQDPNGAYAERITNEMNKLKSDFKDASFRIRARLYVLMQRDVNSESYCGIKIPNCARVNILPIRDRYEALVQQRSDTWEELSKNESLRMKWNEMVDKVNAAETALCEAEKTLAYIESINVDNMETDQH